MRQRGGEAIMQKCISLGRPEGVRRERRRSGRREVGAGRWGGGRGCKTWLRGTREGRRAQQCCHFVCVSVLLVFTFSLFCFSACSLSLVYPGRGGGREEGVWMCGKWRETTGSVRREKLTRLLHVVPQIDLSVVRSDESRACCSKLLCNLLQTIIQWLAVSCLSCGQGQKSFQSLVSFGH